MGEIKDSINAVPWKCVGCKTNVLGYTNAAKTEIRRKYKDDYSVFKMFKGEGELSVVCRKCGLWNTVNFVG